MTPMLATTHGNGPYRPVIVYKGKNYPVGGAFAEMGDALREAQQAAEAIREQMRSPVPPGYAWSTSSRLLGYGDTDR